MNVESTERDMLQPAIRGTRNILIAASRVSTVQSVVITSSFAAVGDTKLGFRPGYTYTSVSCFSRRLTFNVNLGALIAMLITVMVTRRIGTRSHTRKLRILSST